MSMAWPSSPAARSGPVTTRDHHRHRAADSDRARRGRAPRVGRRGGEPVRTDRGERRGAQPRCRVVPPLWASRPRPTSDQTRPTPLRSRPPLAIHPGPAIPGATTASFGAAPGRCWWAVGSAPRDTSQARSSQSRCLLEASRPRSPSSRSNHLRCALCAHRRCRRTPSATRAEMKAESGDPLPTPEALPKAGTSAVTRLHPGSRDGVSRRPMSLAALVGRYD